MKISVIIPNYNGLHLLEKNLPIVLAENKGAQIIIVDDASEDDSVSFIKKNYSEIKVIEKKKNSGFSSTVNLGVKNAGGDLIVLLNSDVSPKKDYLKPLLPYFADKNTFAVGMLQESYENGKIVFRGRGKGEFKRGFLIHRYGQINKNDTLWVSGGAGIFRKSIWNELGGLEEKYDPFYWEDIDLSWRAVQKGYRIWFEKKSIVSHRQSEGAIRTKYTPSEVKVIAFRNQFLFVWLNLREPGYSLRHLLWLPYHFLKIRNKEFFQGFIEAVKRILFFQKTR